MLLKGIKPKQLRDILSRIGKTPGWEVSLRKGGHVKVVNPEGKCTFISQTTYPAALRMIKGDLRRMGWKDE